MEQGGSVLRADQRTLRRNRGGNAQVSSISAQQGPSGHLSSVSRDVERVIGSSGASPNSGECRPSDNGNPDRRSSRRLSTVRSPNIAEVEVSSVNKRTKSLYEDVFEDARILKLPVEHCVSIPELRSRPITEAGVKRFGTFISGGSIGAITGHVSLGRKPLVVPLPHSYRQSILRYFLNKGRNREISANWIEAHQMYHVVDGGHEHEANWRWGEDNEYEFTDYYWMVIAIKWDNPFVVKGMANITRELQSKEFVVAGTASDLVVNLREAAEEQSKREGVVFVRGKSLPVGFSSRVTNLFAGGADYSNKTLSMLTATLVKMSLQTARMMRELLDEELPELAKAVAAKKGSKKCADDNRVFRKLLNTQNLRCTKLFLSDESTEEDRRNVIYRLRFIAEESNKFKGVPASHWDEQTRLVILARGKVDSFKKNVLGTDPWPEEMRTTIDNLYRTTMFDEQLLKSESNNTTLLEILSRRYIEVGGARAATRVDHYYSLRIDAGRQDCEQENHGSNPLQEINADERVDESPSDDACDFVGASPGCDGNLPAESHEVTGADTTASTATPGQGSDDPLQKSVMSARSGTQDSDQVHEEVIDDDGQESHENATDANKEIEELSDTDAVANSSREEAVPDTAQVPPPPPPPSYLDICQVEALNQSWQTYYESASDWVGTFDLVFVEPYQKGLGADDHMVDEDDITKMVSFLRKAMKCGGFCFVILPWEWLGTWKRIFEAKQLSLFTNFRLGLDTESLRKIKGKTMIDPFRDALVFQKPGQSGSIDIESPYAYVSNCRYERKFAVIDNIPAPSQRLTFKSSRAQVRTTEKASSLYWEVLKTFCPPKGRVLDTFGGTFSSGMACIHSFRPCVLLEENKECFDLALSRLTAHAKKIVEEYKLDIDPDGCIERHPIAPGESHQEETYRNHAVDSDAVKGTNYSNQLDDSIRSVGEGTHGAVMTTSSTVLEDADENSVHDFEAREAHEDRPLTSAAECQNEFCGGGGLEGNQRDHEITSREGRDGQKSVDTHGEPDETHVDGVRDLEASGNGALSGDLNLIGPVDAAAKKGNEAAENNATLDDSMELDGRNTAVIADQLKTNLENGFFHDRPEHTNTSTAVDAIPDMPPENATRPKRRKQTRTTAPNVTPSLPPGNAAGSSKRKKRSKRPHEKTLCSGVADDSPCHAQNSAASTAENNVLKRTKRKRKATTRYQS